MAVQHGLQHLHHRRQVGRGHAARHAVAQPVLRAVLGRQGQLQGREEVVDVGLAAAGDDGERAVQLRVQLLQRGNDAGVDLRRIGMRGDVGQRAVEVEE